MKTYCTECGVKIEFSLKKPKFCSNCGHALDGGEKVAEAASTADESQIGFEMDDSENFQVSIKGLEFDFEPDSPNSETLGSIMKSANPEIDPSRESFSSEGGMSAHQHMEQFKAEAGTLRETDSE
jgi:hypothetical protein